MKPSKIVISEGYPKLQSEKVFIIYDQRLARKPKTNSWLGRYPMKLGVQAGEKLKDLDQFPKLAQHVLSQLGELPVKDITLVAVGGGSVGDFAGFLASVLKRGVQLVHIPTTWLAAIDSAHGGKTALNVGHLKNQIGSFYPAESVILSKSLLKTQNENHLRSGYGELFKIALIQGGSLSKQVLSLKKLRASDMWQLLPRAIKAKMKIVMQDPYEKRKIRYLLNLGHTFGHALELEFNISHGEAVLLGIQFALEWSLEKGFLSQKSFDDISSSQLVLPRLAKQINLTRFKKSLAQDKKSAGINSIQFIFVRRVGLCVVKKVSFDQILTEAKRQGWVFK